MVVYNCQVIGALLIISLVKSFVPQNRWITSTTLENQLCIVNYVNKEFQRSSTYVGYSVSDLGNGDSNVVIPPWLVNRCNELGFTDPTPVQQAAIPLIFAGTDVILQAQTGSGKTLAYGIPLVSRIDAKRAAIQAVVVVPSRELGLQVAGVLKQLTAGNPDKIMIMSLVEGSKNRRQQLWAVSEPPHIVVGNPRSLLKLVEMGRLRLNSVSFVVVDEVDACLIDADTRQELHLLLSRRLSNSYQVAQTDSSFQADNMKENLVYSNLANDKRDILASNARYRNNRQTLFCSATIPQRLEI